MEPAQQRVTRSRTNGLRTMGIAEQKALLEELVHIRCDSLRMAVQATYPIVQIIDGDKKDVRLRSNERRAEGTK